jgi:hypothetical protein
MAELFLKEWMMLLMSLAVGTRFMLVNFLQFIFVGMSLSHYYFH